MNSQDPEGKELEDVPVPEPIEQEEPVDSDEPNEENPTAVLEVEVAKWKEMALRTAADLDNYRKRAAREREDAMRYANQSLLEELLPILDNFEMGMQAAAQDKDSMIFVGMDMVRKQLNEFLLGAGVTEIPAAGAPFDPNIHDAVAQESSSEIAEGHVIRTTRRGYMLRDRLLRPAGVVVATAAEDNDGETD